MTTRRALGHHAASVAIAIGVVLLAALIGAYVAGWARAYLPLAAVLPLALICASLGFRAGKRSADAARRPDHRQRTDPLTGLADHAAIADRLADLSAQPLHAGRHSAVLAIDLDHLATLNRQYGRAAGDAVIVTAAAAVRSVLRTGDTAARLGGDEFAIILRDLPAPAAAARVAERLVDALHTPVIVGEQVVAAGASIGVAVRDELTLGGDLLLRHAGTALEAAKRSGRGRLEVYGGKLDNRAREAELRRAIDEGALVVLFQPVVGLSTGGVVAVEALVRWLHPHRGLLLPQEFLELAEETGAIVPLGEWVLREACREAAHWRATVPATEHVRLNVNLSPQQIRRPDLSETVRSILAETGFPADRLVLELAEDAVRHPDEQVLVGLQGLRGHGIGIAVDDVGAGRSGLGHLRGLPVDTLKIDRSFITGIADDPQARTLAEAVVRLGAAADLTVVAEGVETADQARILTAMGCGFGQGFHFSEPLHGRTAAQALRRTFQGAPWKD
ncbi:putative bifunctional diguanylate cyclase/phosphodiesterase [Actinoplanes sp. NPDC051859]|uniref:putative bifunctional diguanylate cyclase/phosphodiesterase n=1 Tax=Actinoplanes sp. NPDC051859 TaxID=3363909 RepID=UPI0037B6D87A